ncbi:MAG: ATPase inhibitor subunit zeta [Pseudomonadota bacterium]
MQQFDTRRRGFEAGFKRSEEMRFEQWMRAVKSNALWVAEQSGKDEAARDAYVQNAIALACTSGDSTVVAARFQADAGPFVAALELDEAIADFLFIARMCGVGG